MEPRQPVHQSTPHQRPGEPCAALDQHPLKVTGAKVTAERISPSADLLVAWLCDRLKVEVTRGNSDGPGITEVSMDTKEGAIRISRADGRLATFTETIMASVSRG